MTQPSLRVCSIDNCDGPVKARGWCGKHWSRWQRHGDPLHIGGRFVGTTEERFWHYVTRTPDGHWLWTGPANSTTESRAYGLLFDSERKRNRLAHRYSWELRHGPIPEGVEPDHLCRVPRCVAPDHLELVSHQTNIDRGESPAAQHARKTHCPRGHEYDLVTAGKRQCSICRRDDSRRWYATNKANGLGTGGANRIKTHCPKGHPFDEENTYVRPDRPGTRDCLTCRRERSRQSRLRRMGG